MGIVTAAVPQEVRARLAPLLGQTEREALERMRVVTGAPGRWLPPLLRTTATTLGRYVLFRLDRYDPASPRGLALLAHEAVHVRDYERLGVARFLARYGRGLLAARFVHDRHPMEQEAIAVRRRVRRALEEAAPDANREARE